MEKVVLKASVRKGIGKAAAKSLRKKGVIPANVYKGAGGALSIQVSEEDLNEVLHTKAGENVIITLKISGGESVKDKTVLIKEIQREPIKDSILHVDFNEISLTETLKVNVPLAAKGEAVGVKVDGGILEHVMWELQVECLPTEIPEKIEVDVSNLKIGDAIYVKDIAVPSGIKVLNDPELIAIIVKAKKVEVPKEEVAAEAATEPELIRKKKEEVEEEGAGVTEAPAKEAAKEQKETKKA
ncbi:MAG: 50S ribosomal protein L25 [Candidatus Omnitrophica bacterium]|nr:50S ribosomal protein L25 [Candidatus Omnitrophota bacterium]MCM8791186.1 50S ribosomal protein L25 [Candidatus Omnitrophota bacterium]